jgi:hypothetical protein
MNIEEVMATVWGNVAHFWANGAPTAQQLSDAMSRVGPDQAPLLLARLDEAHLLTREALIANVGWAWSGTDFPGVVPEETWRHWFAVTGYTIDGEYSRRPPYALMLYRGATARRRLSWSWTDDLRHAQWFARRNAFLSRHHEPGTVWRATVEPWRLFARNTRREDLNGTESEYVIDTRGLWVTAQEPPGD